VTEIFRTAMNSSADVARVIFLNRVVVCSKVGSIIV